MLQAHRGGDLEEWVRAIVRDECRKQFFETMEAVGNLIQVIGKTLAEAQRRQEEVGD